LSELADIAITIAPETPLQDEIRALIRELNAHLSALSPPEFCFQMTAEQIAETATTLFVARDGTGKAVGMGALKRHADGIGEVKRMYTLPHLRGHHIGRAILNRIEYLARSEGSLRLVLETGIERTHGDPGGSINATASSAAARCSTIPMANGTCSSKSHCIPQRE
jgi:putative acetyltransferase